MARGVPTVGLGWRMPCANFTELTRPVDSGHAQLFVICNKVGDWLTGNLLGPIVVNAANRLTGTFRLDPSRSDSAVPAFLLGRALGAAHGHEGTDERGDQFLHGNPP